MWTPDPTSPTKSCETNGLPRWRFHFHLRHWHRWIATAEPAARLIYVPEGLPGLKDREIFIITIGESAALAAVCEGIPCIGLQNAWAWAAGRPHADEQELAEIEAPMPAWALTEFARPYRRVLVLGGSDLMEDGADRRGLELLTAALQNQDIRAQLAYCPSGVVLERGQRRITHQGLYEWLNSPDRRLVKPNVSALFFAAEVLGCADITDSFNARMIADLFPNELAYSRGGWYVWDGCTWSRDGDEIRRKLAVRVAKRYQAYAERLQKLVASATGAYGKKDLPNPLAAWVALITPPISSAMKAAASVQNLRTMDAAFTIAQAHLRVPSDAWDRGPHLLAVQNGVIDLRTGTLQPPSPAFRMTRVAGCAFDPATTAPRFEQFLSEVQPDEEVRAYLQRLIGYAATGDAKEQKFFSFLGGGNNGKSTFIGLILDALGDYALKANPGLLAEQLRQAPQRLGCPRRSERY